MLCDCFAVVGRVLAGTAVWRRHAVDLEYAQVSNFRIFAKSSGADFWRKAPFGTTRRASVPSLFDQDVVKYNTLKTTLV